MNIEFSWPGVNLRHVVYSLLQKSNTERLFDPHDMTGVLQALYLVSLVNWETSSIFVSMATSSRVSDRRVADTF